MDKANVANMLDEVEAKLKQIYRYTEDLEDAGILGPYGQDEDSSSDLKLSREFPAIRCDIRSLAKGLRDGEYDVDKETTDETD